MDQPVDRSIAELLRTSAQVRGELAKRMEHLRESLKVAHSLMGPANRPVTFQLPPPVRRQVTIGLLDALTPREVEVLRLIAEGVSSKDIAKRLKIRFKTVVCHRSRILQKLRVHETASLVRIAIRAGLIEP